MLSTESRCHYRLSPLAEVVCQLRFPEILTIATTIPDQFQEKIRSEFPRFVRLQETPKPVAGNVQLQNPPRVTNYQFSSADDVWRVNLTSRFISLRCGSYTCWEDFAQKLDMPLAAFIKLYKPAYFERVGLRYVNFFSRQALDLEGVPYSQMFAPCYLGPLAEPDVIESNCRQCSVDTEMAIRGGCRVRLHAGPGMVKRGGVQDKEVKFILDMDLYMPGQVPVNLSAGALQTLHSQSYPIFRGAITDMTHSAMEPEPI